jgi:hypothetical protein
MCAAPKLPSGASVDAPPNVALPMAADHRPVSPLATVLVALCVTACANVRDADMRAPGPILLQPDLGQGPKQEARDRAACDAWAADVSGRPVPPPGPNSERTTAPDVGRAQSSLARLRDRAYVGALLECLERRGYTP